MYHGDVFTTLVSDSNFGIIFFHMPIYEIACSYLLLASFLLRKSYEPMGDALHLLGHSVFEICHPVGYRLGTGRSH